MPLPFVIRRISLPLLNLWAVAGESIDGPVCSIIGHGAVADNRTLNTKAIQSAIDTCHADHPEGSTVLVPEGAFLTGPILLRSYLRLHLASGAGLYGSSNISDYPIVYNYVGPPDRMSQPLISGYNLTNVSITGSNVVAPGNTSIIDGVGWKWWCLQKKCFHFIPEYCKAFNPDNSSLPRKMLIPKLIEFFNITGLTLSSFTAQNSAFWHIHPIYSRDVTMRHMTVLGPRNIGCTDGIDPDSVENMLLEDSHIDVGDDAISIKSINITINGRQIMAPSRNITMRRLNLLARNWCIGSQTFGGVYDILFEDSSIGAPDHVTAPWGIKFKAHRYYPGPMQNITFRRLHLGPIGPTPWEYPNIKGYAIIMGLDYHDKPPAHRSGAPIIRNVSFEDIYVASADGAGDLTGLPESCIEQLSFRNVTVGGRDIAWKCSQVDGLSLIAENVSPPLTCDFCNSIATIQSESTSGGTQVVV